MEPIRIAPSEVRKRVQAGKAILVCGYSDEEAWKAMQLEGAISLKEFESRLSTLPKSQEIIFYCG